nr:glutathione S-transferase [Gluconacetobacter diazotrophicus]
MPPSAHETEFRDLVFDAWLKGALRRTFDNVTKEPVPETLLRLIEPSYPHEAAGAKSGTMGEPIMAQYVLYNCGPSGNCYKVRLFAALAGIPLKILEVDLAGGEHRQPAFTALNPWQQVPVLQDGEIVIWDSQAILVYLAERYAEPEWCPPDPLSRARVMQWLSVSANEIQHGPADARLVRKFAYPLNYDHAVRLSSHVLTTIDAHLADREWLALHLPSIADCAAYPYIALAPEGGISLEPYDAIRAWMARIEALPGYVPIGS